MSLEDLTSVSRVLADIRQGGLAILTDTRTGTGDLVMAAGQVSAAGVNFMATHGRGLTELALSPARIDHLRLPPMASRWGAPRKAFAVSIEARRGVSTGISARDRAQTIRVAVASDTTAEDVISPGHVFPLRGRDDGPGGRTEAALALAQLAECGEGAVLSSILDDDGELARDQALQALAHRFGLRRISVEAVLAHGHRRSRSSERINHEESPSWV